MIQKVKSFVKTNIWGIVIITVASFLRLYKLSEYVTFLGDQGRDAIIIKRIVTLEHFPAIGAPTSIGQIFLGPFYYYFIAPFLLLWNFNPAGLAFGVAITSIIGLIAIYFILKIELGLKLAVIFTTLLSFSSVNIELSRFSWNPNLLPLFSFFTIYFLYCTLKDKSIRYALALGSCFALSSQLHYLAMLLAFPVGIIFLRDYLQKKYNKRLFITKVSSIIGSYIFFSIPLIIFDLKHGFLNVKSLIRLFTEPGDEAIIQPSLLSKIIETNHALFNHVFKTDLAPFITNIIGIIFLGICIQILIQRKTPQLVRLFTICLISFMLLFPFVNSWRYYHYYGPVYYSFFVVCAYGLTHLISRKKIGIVIFTLCITIYFALNAKTWLFLFNPGNNQIMRAQHIAQSIKKRITTDSYQIVAIPSTETTGHIRYYLELYGNRPMPEESALEGVELFVLCKEVKCQVLGHPQWQIAAFSNAKIDTIWDVEYFKVFKLIHAKPSP